MRKQQKIYLLIYSAFSCIWFVFILVWLRVVSPQELIELLPGLVDLVSAVILALQQGPLTDVMSACYNGIFL